MTLEGRLLLSTTQLGSQESSVQLISPGTSPQFPPSPPPSVGAESPSPVQQKSPECRLPLLPPPCAASPRALPFSIENILRPDFGGPAFRESAENTSSELILRTPPKTPEFQRQDSPVDLSHKTHDKTLSFAGKDTPQKGVTCRPKNPEVLANPTIPDDSALWPAWVYCTRYSDRPSSGPRSRRIKRQERKPEEKRPRTAFTSEQLSRLKKEFDGNKYLTEKRRQDLAKELGLNESQIKIWFQNKRAKIKKSTGQKNPLAQQLMAQGLYNHSTVPVDEDDDILMN